MAERELHDNLISGKKTGVKENSLFDETSEKALLAVLLKNPKSLDGIINKKLLKEHFYDPKNALIFEAITKLYMENREIDQYTVVDRLRQEENIGKAGGNSYVMSIPDTYAVASSADEYVEMIIDKATRRKMVKVLEEALENTTKGASTSEDLIDATVGKFNSLRNASNYKGFQPLKEIIKMSFNNMFDIITGEGNKRIVKTGYRRLDSILGGLRPGTLNILAARPGMGKTSLALNIAANAARFYKTNVCIFSLEMSKVEIGNKIIAALTNTSAKKIQYANMSLEEQAELARACGEFSNIPILVDDSGDVTSISMLSACKKLKADDRLDLIIIDYLQLLRVGDGNSRRSEREELTIISRNLKMLAKELDVPVIALSQLSRDSAKNEEDHVPDIADLRGSGSIEQDADSVWFVHRDDYFNKDKDEANKYEQDARIIVAKNRHGETGNVYVKWIGSRTLFKEITKKSDPTEPESSYTRTQSAQSSAASFSYEEADLPEQAPIPDDAAAPDMPDVPQGPDLSEPFDPQEIVTEESAPEIVSNDEMFSDNVSTDFPEGLF
ncbi:MAG: replicative DNA helicase [Clostridiales bacterium]|nr:replicative DNA helicase [Clostridiales bacterium]